MTIENPQILAPNQNECVEDNSLYSFIDSLAGSLGEFISDIMTSVIEELATNAPLYMKPVCEEINANLTDIVRSSGVPFQEIYAILNETCIPYPNFENNPGSIAEGIHIDEYLCQATFIYTFLCAPLGLNYESSLNL